MFYISLIATTKLKSITPSQRERNLSIHERKLSSHKGRDKENRDGTKELQNSQQNGNSKFIPINNHFINRLKFLIKRQWLN